MPCVVELAVLRVHDADGSEKEFGVRFLGSNVATNVAQECALAYSPHCCVHDLLVQARQAMLENKRGQESILRVTVTGRHNNTMLLRVAALEPSASALGKRSRPYYAGEI